MRYTKTAVAAAWICGGHYRLRPFAAVLASRIGGMEPLSIGGVVCGTFKVSGG